MKPVVRVLVSAFALTALVACQKKPESVAIPSGAGESVQVVPVQAGESAFVFRPQASFWELKDGDLKWLDSLQVGQGMEVLGKTEKGAYKGEEYDVVKVKLAETQKEGWIIESQIAVGAAQAVVVSDLATLYRQPKDTAVMETIIPRLALVATWPVDGNADFYKVLLVNPETGDTIRDRFLAATDLSQSAEDINASLLLQAVRNAKTKEQKKKLVDTIMQKYSSTAFAPVVQELSTALDPANLGKSAISGAYIVKEKAIVRDIPSIFGYQVGSLDANAEATVVEGTSEEYTVGNLSGPWLRISAPKEGWVFGPLLSAKQ